MKKIWCAVLLMSLGVSRWALAAPDVPLIADLQAQRAQTLENYQANERSYLVSVRNGSGTAQPLAGYAPVFYWAASNTASVIVTARCEIVTATAGTFRAVFSAGDLNWKGTGLYAVGVSSGGVTIARQGTWIVYADPYATGADPIRYTTNINWNLISWVGLPTYVSSNQLGAGFTWNGSQWETEAAAGNGATQAMGEGRLALGYDAARKAVTGSVDVTGLATGTPLYGLDGTLYATGTPLYGESDPLWTADSNAIAVQIGEKLSTTIWAQADSTTNYMQRTAQTASNAAFASELNSLTTNVAARLPLSAFEAYTSVWASLSVASNEWQSARILSNEAAAVSLAAVDTAQSLTNAAVSVSLASLQTNVDARMNAADQHASNATFTAQLATLNTGALSQTTYLTNRADDTNRLALVEGYTNRAAVGLASSVWAQADATTNYVRRSGDTGSTYQAVGNLLALGSARGAEMVANGGFSGSQADWAFVGFQYNSGKAVLNTGLSGSVAPSNALAVVPGKTYAVSFTVGLAATTTITTTLGGSTNAMAYVGNNGSAAFFLTAGDGSSLLIAFSTSSGQVSLDDISVLEVTDGDVIAGRNMRAGGSLIVGDYPVTPSNYVNKTGDTMSGDLTISGSLLIGPIDEEPLMNNTAGDYCLALGLVNAAMGEYAAALGGGNNTASGNKSAIIAGAENVSSGERSVVVAGGNNTSAGDASLVLGGYENTASGNSSISAGYRASATHNNSFVWGDGLRANKTSMASNTFNVWASDGTYFLDTRTSAVVRIHPSTGLQIGTNTFRVDIEGNVTATNVWANLGAVTARTVSAEFFGDGSGLTNLPPATSTNGVNSIIVGASNYTDSVTFYGAVSASATGIVFTATGSGSGATNITFDDNWATGTYDSGNATFTVGHPTFAAGSGIDPVIASNSFALKSGDTITGPMTNTSLYIDYGYGNVGTGSNIYFLGGISNRVERMSQAIPVGPVGVIFGDNNMIRGSNIYHSTIVGSAGCGIHGAGLYRAIVSSQGCFDTNNTTAIAANCTFIGGSYGSKIITSAQYGNAIVGAKNSTISSGSNSGILGGDGSTISVATAGILGGGGHSIAAASCCIIGGGNGYIGSSAQGCSVILGGNYNRIEGGGYNVIGGGQYNIFSGASYNSSIINGSYNACKTGASFSVVGGYKASAKHTRCFVWSDNNRGNAPFNNTNSFFESTSTNQFLVHATGGVGINTNAPLAALHVNGTTRSDAYQFSSGAKIQEVAGDTNTLYFVTPDGLTTGRITIAY